MKNKISIVLAGVLITTSPIFSKVGGISVDELSNKDKFKEFKNINKKVVESFIDSRSKTNKVGKQEILHYNKKAVGRIYHLKPSGYIVATLNKNDVPIKAHSFNGDFNKLPEEYKNFLSARLYEYIQITEELEKTQKLDTENKKMWEYLETYTEDSPKPIIESNILSSNNSTEKPPELPNKNQRAYDAGDVLVDVHWNQHAPYNNYTEPINDIHALTGCGATAWAQIMKFHEWPIEPEGTVSYEWPANSNVFLTKNLNISTRYNTIDFNNNYNWSNMPSAGNNEVATLMADIGYTIKSNWGLGVTTSSADSSSSLELISEHFGYSTLMYKVGYTTFTNSTQFNTIRDTIEDNIDLLQPLLHSYYYGSATGHGTVIDGYQNIISGASSFEVHMNVGYIDNDMDHFYTISKSLSTISSYPVIDTITSMRVLAGIRPCNGGSDCHSSYIGGRKNGLTLQDGWNLISLISSGNDIDSRDFTNATAVKKFNHLTQKWVLSGTFDINPKEGVWVQNDGASEYIFPGAQTQVVKLTSDDLDEVSSGNWALVGTGVTITDDSLISSTNFSDCHIFNANTKEWEINGCMAPNDIPAGRGMWIKKK